MLNKKIIILICFVLSVGYITADEDKIPKDDQGMNRELIRIDTDQLSQKYPEK